MPQLETLTLHSASPIASGDFTLPYDVELIVTLPSFAKLDVSFRERLWSCACPSFPALTLLSAQPHRLTARSRLVENSDVQKIHSYVVRHVVRHAHGPQPLQSLSILNEGFRANVLAWTMPDVDDESYHPVGYSDPISACVNLLWS